MSDSEYPLEQRFRQVADFLGEAIRPPIRGQRLAARRRSPAPGCVVIGSAVGALDRAVVDAGAISSRLIPRSVPKTWSLSSPTAAPERPLRTGVPVRPSGMPVAATVPFERCSISSKKCRAASCRSAPGEIADVLHHAGCDARTLKRAMTASASRAAVQRSIEASSSSACARRRSRSAKRESFVQPALADDGAEADPFGLAPNDDHAPAVVAPAAIAAVRRVVPRTVPEPPGLHAVRQPLHHDVPDGRDRRLELRQVDVLPLPRPPAMVERAHARRRGRGARSARRDRRTA
jgi:hypothetical protein